MPLSCGDGEPVSLSSLLEAIPQTVLAQVDTAEMHFFKTTVAARVACGDVLSVLPPRAFVVTPVPQAGVIRSWIPVNPCFRHIVLFSKQTIVSKKFEALAYIMEDGP